MPAKLLKVDFQKIGGRAAKLEWVSSQIDSHRKNGLLVFSKTY